MKLETKLAHKLIRDHPSDAAAVLEALPTPSAVSAVRGRPPGEVASILRRMASHSAAPILERLPEEDAVAIVSAMEAEFAASLLRRIDTTRRNAVLESLDQDTHQAVRTLLSYPANSAANLMDPNVLALPVDLSVKEALRQVRESPKHVLFNVYVVDREGILVGVLNLRELLIASPSSSLEETMKSSTHRIAADADRHTIIEHPGWSEVHSLPVVDARGRFLGALRHRTLKRLEVELARMQGARSQTVAALGDLFWTGVAGMLDAVTLATARGITQDENSHAN